VFGFLAAEVLPDLAASGRVRAWSAGCASGEEAYTLSIMWELELAERFPSAKFAVLASDVEEAMLGRARRGCYGAGSLRELPERWRMAAFTPCGGEVRLRARFRESVSIERHDVLRDSPPEGGFDLVLCRNLAFTYFDEAGQRVVAEHLSRALRPGGALVLGRHETLPAGRGEFEAWSDAAGVYRRASAGS
jgi:chemotaxis protein methyltransferase CheR